MQASDAHHVTGTATYTVGVVPGLSVSLSGALRYSGAGPVTSGAITVAPTGSTAIRSITGRAALPGASGGTAAVTFSLYRATVLGHPVYLGVIKVSDPSAGISVLTPSITASVSRLGPAAASGQTQWVAVSNGKPSKYTLSFEVVGVG